MAPFYKYVTELLKLPFDQALFSKMEATNKEDLAKFDEKVEAAEQNMGETEVNEPLLGKADYYAQIGDKVNKKNEVIYKSVLFFLFSFSSLLK